MTGPRGRVDRQTEERTERRRRSDVTIDGGQRLKLAIPPEVAERLKAEGRTPRWVNDEGNRMHNLTRLDDYDKVAGVDPVPVGTTKEGKPIKAHLCSKKTAYIEIDKAKLDERRKETERAMLRGKVPGDPSTGQDDRYSSSFVDEASSIRRGGLGPP
jgi:hypothetical protein